MFIHLLQFTNAVNVRGVAPEDMKLYEPDNDGYFHCLSDFNIKIPFNRVNDDFCDCPDGSDEPGTSACENGKFYCVGSEQYIPSRFVNDGVCDYELCCDGSEEADGVCTNKCEEIRELLRQREEDKRQFQMTGSALRQQMVDLAQIRQTELKSEISTNKRLVASLDPQIKQLNAEIEQISKQAKLNADQSQIGKPLEDVRLSLKNADELFGELRGQAERFRDAYNTLSKAFKEMSIEYNPNFNDPAVKAAIKVWKELEKPSNYLVAKRTFSNDDALEEIEKVALNDFGCDLNDFGVFTKIVNFVEQIALMPLRAVFPFNNKSNSKVGTLYLTRLKEQLSQLESDKKQALKSLETQTHLTNLDESFWGDLFIGHAAEDVCVEQKKGDFTYTACLFLEAVQNDGFHNVRLGKSQGLKGEYGNYYIDFEGGDPCPGGVKRSLRLLLECGHETEAYFVEEPEVCHYEMKARSPIGCKPLDNGVYHDEV